MATRFNPPDVWQPFGAFAMAAMPEDGQLLFLKGQVALDRDGDLVGANDMRSQVRQTPKQRSPALAAR